MNEVTAGTAGDGFRATQATHVYQPARIDYGQRPVCRCGLERHEHVKEAS